MRFLLGPLLLLAVVVAPLARADEPPKPPVTEAEWEARDLEGRWVLTRTAPASGGSWVSWLAEHKEWPLLAWIVLSGNVGNGSDALPVMSAADASPWVATAVWMLGATDSHTSGAAREVLRKRPGLVRAWFQRFPAATRGPAADLVKALEEGQAPVEDATSLAPPLDPEVLLADLSPPPQVAEFGDRKRAEPGVRYVHQVERALAFLGQVGLPGEPWSSRLVALLGHAHPALRRGALLAFARRAPGDIPVALLSQRVEDTSEQADVRAAAILGLSYSDHPAGWRLLLRVGTDPHHPVFRAAVSRLADLDHGFVLETWWALEARMPAGPLRTFLQQQSGRLGERLAAHTAADHAQLVKPMLERAAWLDLGCDPLGGALLAWTQKSLVARLAGPPVRSALETVRDAYEPAPGWGAMGTVSNASLQARVRDLARGAPSAR